MTTEQNKTLVRRYRELHNTNQLDQLDEIVASDLITHNLLPGLPPGLEGGKMAHMGGVASFPDVYVKTEDLVAEGDQVVERWTISGSFTGAAFFGAPPNGKKFSVGGISMYLIANNHIVEHWGEMDTLGLLQQLGMIPAPGQ